MSPDGRNPPFSRAISHGTAIIDLLLKVVVFGPSRGTISDLIWGPFQTSYGDRSDLILDRKLTRGDSISNSETSIRTQMRTRQFKLSKSSSAV